MITPSGRKVTKGDREKKEREKKAVNSGHLVLWQRTQAAWANKLGLPDWNICLDIPVQVNLEPEFQILVPVSILVPLGPINWVTGTGNWIGTDWGCIPKSAS
jgi:hypothetical protein